MIPLPTATNIPPYPTTPYPAIVNTVEPNPVHVVPLEEEARVLTPCPVATNKLLFHVIPFVFIENNVYPSPVHVVPLVLE